MPPLATEDAKLGSRWGYSQKQKAETRTARISTLEIAIRTQAKHFLAHPLVVQHLEAIWAGTIIFHSAADSLHRPVIGSVPGPTGRYGATGGTEDASTNQTHGNPLGATMRRAVTLYNPRQASVFKLSRLRVPRYRQFLSTCSLAVLLGLFVAVLAQRSLNITVLEIVFWFWSAGFMLDEIVGFNEQGFSLYILSVWNAFDLGILLLLMCYYGMRLSGILASDVRKRQVAHMAYDVLAANAVFLFPRLFSVLDHYRYFSQLLIGFRMMAMDLVAVLILIVISCSGFFVAFTLSFGDDGYDAGSVAFALFQMVMGFSPAAWTYWEEYNLLGRGILTLFLFITHFLVITILVSVLNNSFTAIVRNADEEHQFLFAVNTISMVKSDALFSYIAPTNIIGWTLTPLRYILPLRQFVRLNRTVIKATHLPVLLLIYVYERVVLRNASFQPMQQEPQHGHSNLGGFAFKTPGFNEVMVGTKHTRLREPSIAASRKDRALEEVFRTPFKNSKLYDSQRTVEQRNRGTVVNDWMRRLSSAGIASPSAEQDPSTVGKPHRPYLRRLNIPRQRLGVDDHEFSDALRSVASDPEDFGARSTVREAYSYRRGSKPQQVNLTDLPEQTDGDGDDELQVHEEEEELSLVRRPSHTESLSHDALDSDQSDYELPQLASTTNRAKHVSQPLGSPAANANPARMTKRSHNRNESSKTVIYSPMPELSNSASLGNKHHHKPRSSAANTRPGSRGPLANKRSSNSQDAEAIGSRPITSHHSAFRSAPDLAGMLMLGTDPENRRPTSLALDLGSDLGDNQAIGGGFLSGVPASFTTQMAMATSGMRYDTESAHSGEDQRRMSRLMLARMDTLEEGFREAFKEMKEWRREERVSGGRERRGGKVKSSRGLRRRMDTLSDDEQVSLQDWMDLFDITAAHRGSSM